MGTLIVLMEHIMCRGSEGTETGAQMEHGRNTGWAYMTQGNTTRKGTRNPK